MPAKEHAVTSALLPRLPSLRADRFELSPRTALVVMLLSTLLAGAAIQHSIDRLEAASQTRMRLDRQSAGLHERYATEAASTSLAMQQLRTRHDEAVAAAADLGRWTVWATLIWLTVVAGVSLHALWRRRDAGGLNATPRAAGEAAAAQAASAPDARHNGKALCTDGLDPSPAAAATSAAAAAQSTTPQPSRPAQGDWAQVMQEMQALSAWIGEAADPTLRPDTPLNITPGPAAAVEHSAPTAPVARGREALRLAA